MNRGVFGNRVRKYLNNNHIKSDLIRELYDLYIGDNSETGTMEESVPQFLKRVGETYGLSKPNTALNNHKTFKPKIKQYSINGAKAKQKEDAAMRNFWNKNLNEQGFAVCAESGVWIKEYNACFVHHIFSKGSNPFSRCDEDNFIILTFENHQRAEREDKTMKVYNYMQEVKKKMKLKYANKVLSDFEKLKK